MSSGIAVRQEVLDRFQDVKKNHLYRYVVFMINADKTAIVVEKVAEKDKSYKDFEDDMRVVRDKGECRYAIFDYEFQLDNGQKRNKLVLICWSPDSLSAMVKMPYSSGRDALKRKLGDGFITVQATDDDELSETHIHEVCKANTRE